jgi:hypothetical protein
MSLSAPGRTRGRLRHPYSVLLPVGFTLPPPSPEARCAFTAPFHPCPPRVAPRGPIWKAVCFLWHFPWGRPRRPLAGTVFPWSPDFPPSSRDNSGRPAVWRKRHGTVWGTRQAVVRGGGLWKRGRAMPIQMVEEKHVTEAPISDRSPSGPPDNAAIVRAAFLARDCPTFDRLRHFQMERIAADRDGALVTYACSPSESTSVRNTEYLTIRDGRVARRQCLFRRASGGTETSWRNGRNEVLSPVYQFVREKKLREGTQ